MRPMTDGRIFYICVTVTRGEHSACCEIVDAQGAYVIPGFIDTHKLANSFGIGHKEYCASEKENAGIYDGAKKCGNNCCHEFKLGLKKLECESGNKTASRALEEDGNDRA